MSELRRATRGMLIATAVTMCIYVFYLLLFLCMDGNCFGKN